MEAARIPRPYLARPYDVSGPPISHAHMIYDGRPYNTPVSCARIGCSYLGRPYDIWRPPVSHARISGAHMIYGGHGYPTLTFFGSPEIECRIAMATLTSLHPDLISPRSSASSNSDSDFDSTVVDSSAGSMVAFAIDSCIDSRAVDSRIDYLY